MIKNKYTDWINNYTGDIYRKCVEVTKEMVLLFPELHIVKGMVTIMENDKDYQHQWLVDSEGNIVDPTAHQWLGIVKYKEIKEEDDKPIGKCIECGEWVYGCFVGGVCCSSVCLMIATRALNTHY